MEETKSRIGAREVLRRLKAGEILRVQHAFNHTASFANGDQVANKVMLHLENEGKVTTDQNGNVSLNKE